MAMAMRALALAAGLTGAAGLSQFPEFTQQYKQRLGGAVDELSRVIEGFDTDAQAEGLSREAALVQMAEAGGVAARRARSVVAVIDRHARLQADSVALTGAGPFTRLTRLPHLADPELARRVWQSYQPALPLNFEGVVFSALGFAAGLGIAGLLRALFAPMFRRRRRVARVS